MDSSQALRASSRSSPGWESSQAASEDESMLLEVEEGQSVGQRRHCKEYFQTFWSLTTNIEYISSEWSRRRLLRFVLPLATITFLVFDISCDPSRDQSISKYLIAGLEVGLLLIFLVVGLLPMHSIWIDVVVVASLLSYTLFHRSVVQDAVPIEVLWTFLLFQSGVRSCFAFVYGLISSVYLFIFNKRLGILALSYVMIAMLSEAFGTDYKMAAMWAELQENKSVVAFLLDHASSGFCTVDPNSGLIQSASSSLQRNLRMGSLRGVSVLDLMNLRNRSAQKFNSMCSIAAGGATPQPEIVECQIKDMKFAAKMIPYRSSRDGLEICFQIKSGPAGHENLSTPESLYLLSATSKATSEEEISWNLTPEALQRHGKTPPTLIETGMQTESTLKIGTLHPSGVPSLPRPERSRSLDEASSSSGGGGDDPIRGRQSRQRSRRKKSAPFSFDQDGELVPQLESFDTTNNTTCVNSARWLFKHWNLPKDRSSCCPWHATLKVVIRLLKSEMKGQCDQLWSPLSGWQCEACASMNKEEADLCQFCGGESKFYASQHAQEDLSAVLAEVSSNAEHSPGFIPATARI